MTKNKTINVYFWITFFIIFLSLTCLFFDVDTSISGDGYGYYEYFVRTFINNDFESYTGAIKYPVGTTLLQLPFLLFSYCISSIFNIDLGGGYSSLFQNTVLFSSNFYCFISLIIIYKMIKINFKDKIAALACLSLFFGTMLLYYSTYDASYSHIYGFFTCSLFLYFTIYYEDNYKKANNIKKLLLDIIFGIILGLVFLVRYTNIIIYFAYILYKVNNITDLKNRLKTVFSKKIWIHLSILLFLFLIQVILYKIFNNGIMLHGYSDEKFIYLFNPQIYKVLFSVTKGLFIYCPLLFLGFLGIFFIDYENNFFKIAQPLIFVLLTYIVSSWWCWWLGMGYTERIYCDMLCIFAYPIASVLNLGFELNKDKSKKMFSIILFFIVILFILLNLIWIRGIVEESIDSNFSSWYMLKNHLLTIFMK